MKLTALEIEDPPVEHCHSPYAWIRVVFDGGMDDKPAVLEAWPPTEWIDYELSDHGLEAFVDLSDGTFWWEWMLHNGIAPGQEFILRVEQPSCTQGYAGDYDTDFGDWEIVDRQRLPEGAAGRLWFAWIRDLDYRKIEVFKV